MSDVQLQLTDIAVNVMAGSDVKNLLSGINLTVNKGDFVTIIGTNGAGKSTLFNTICGDLLATSGTIELAGERVEKDSPEKRARHIARVFQDPKMGTAPRMTVSENLALAMHRGKRLGLRSRALKQKQAEFLRISKQTPNGIDQALDKPTEELSGGQRQALSLLMATMQKPDLLMLDEHTAALDPHTSKAIMELTDKIVRENDLTCMMITHQMDDAIKYGNRLIVVDAGHIVADYSAEDKAKLNQADLLKYFA
ncbi:ABC transporter ATP-binding protein [Lacticaseibacillus songhuajiangensis]|jgi:putative ABC transport system ATP-binding protein|uniref:ABC transporter ATP-binding protein n=1 Tax=Lacticaseibacillus songhuajiangensis TaxID=1296539 RepID=UPI000F78CE47|nr:ATP-binding cassette domain-containing protein [Lacticaseibacillus songhuajiangensis]MCI1283382.1 ATP-binding cassette domain-containing protein [Lacticaseibacillus songhuajiangensis]